MSISPQLKKLFHDHPKAKDNSMNVCKSENEIADEIHIVHEIFKYNLRLLRAGEGLSAERLSVALYMPVKRINDLEEGRMPPKFEDLVKIVDYFPITYDDLLDGKLTLDIRSHKRNQNVRDNG